MEEIKSQTLERAENKRKQKQQFDMLKSQQADPKYNKT